MKNLTFIFQGPYYHEITDKCIKVVEKNFPSSKLLFSTWTGQQVPAGLVDKVIYSPDPGGQINSIWNTSDSTLRQLFSTYNALVDVTTDYCCKIRSDTCLENNRLLELIEYLQSNNLNKIIFLNYLSVNPRRFPLAFHFCDWMVAGRTSELRNIFLHIGQKNEGINHFFGVTADMYQYGWYCRYRSEQYIILNWIKNLKNSIRINYYDWECGESLRVLGMSAGKEFMHCLYFSARRMVLSPAYALKFMLHILRYKSGAGLYTG
jgi:hypothetical protein